MARKARGRRGRPATLEESRRRIAELEKLEGRQGNIEAALRDSESRYRFLYEENPSMYFTVDPDGIVQSVNPFGADQLGYEVSDLVGKPVFQVFHPEDRESVRRQLRTCVADAGKAFSWELRKVRSDRRVMWVREVARAAHDRHGNIVVLVVCEDITTRKTVEEELRRAHAEMERRVAERTEELRRSEEELRLLAGRLLTAQEDERRRLAREMHDDLTQRLAGIAMQAGRLGRLQTDSSAQAAELVRSIGADLSQLSSDVHALSRRLHPSILSDLGLVDAVAAECTAFTKLGQVEVEFDASDVPDEIDDETAICLYRIAQEALRNVAKHSETNRARVSLGGEEGAVVLVVTDDGVGFDTSRMRGVGLGLASMEERARLVRAECIVESRAGEGTTVTVRAPLSR